MQGLAGEVSVLTWWDVPSKENKKNIFVIIIEIFKNLSNFINSIITSFMIPLTAACRKQRIHNSQKGFFCTGVIC